MDYLRKFKEELSFSNLAPASEYRYLKGIERYLEFTRGNPTFTREEIMDFLNSLGNTTSTYKNWNMQILKRFYGAIKQEWPLHKREGPRIEVRPQPYLKAEEVRALLDAAKGNKRDYAIIQLFYDTMMRRDELCKLDYNGYNGSELLIKLSKGEEYRTVRLTLDARRALDNYLRARQDNNPALFINSSGGRISQAVVSTMIKGYLQQLGIYKPGLGSHGFRRGGVTSLVKKGAPELLIARWGGWKSTSMISRYAQLTAGEAQVEIDKYRGRE